MGRNPFEFLDSGSRERTLLHLLIALVRKQGGEVELTLEDLTAVADGDSLWKYYSADTGTRLVLRFARKGAEAYFLTADSDLSETRRTFPTRTAPAPQPGASQPLPAPRRHAIHDDLDYALREEDMARVAAEAARQRNREARAEAGTLPWRNVKPQ